MRTSFILLLLGVGALGCTPAITTQPPLQHVGIPALGFKGRLAGDHRMAVPASVAAALDPGADVVFTYDERITQSHDELPVVLMLFTSTLHLLGVPTGRDEVQAHADLTVSRHERELGRYRADAAASQIYGLYYGADTLELENQARAAVRRAVDEALYADTARLRAGIASAERP